MVEFRDEFLSEEDPDLKNCQMKNSMPGGKIRNF